MKIRNFLILIAILLVQPAFSAVYPYWPGTQSGSAIAGKDINIIREKVDVKIKKDIRQADITVEYLLKSEESGVQIPLIFYADNYVGGFSVSLNDKPVQLSKVESDFDFSAFGMPEIENAENLKLSYGDFGRNDGEIEMPLIDLKYFKTDLNEGIHKVVLKYTAEAWVDQSGTNRQYIKEYSYRYSLAAAKQWKSAGGMDLTIESEDPERHFTVNLGDFTEELPDRKHLWKMDGAPSVDHIVIQLTPKVSSLHQTFLNLFPVYIWLFGIVLMLPLIWWMVKRWRKRNPGNKPTGIIIVAVLLFPLLVFGWMLLTSYLIDSSGNPEIYIPGGVAFQFILFVVGVIIFSLAVLLPVLWMRFKNKS